MMSSFLLRHREELIRRCTAKVAQRPMRQATPLQLSNGIPLFLGQLQRTLEAEERLQPMESLKISGASGGDALSVSEMGLSASAHGRQLLALGFSVDQVVHDYGDLCQAITDLAVESDAPFAVSEFRTLNRCLDNGIASAVTAFTSQRDVSLARKQHARATEQEEVLLRGLRNALATATYAVVAMEIGNLPVSGSTGSILKKSLEAIRKQVGGPTLDEIRKETSATD
jgi:hypothetical protein